MSEGRRSGTPRVTIITVNFNETETTAALLDSIQRQWFPGLEVIVVDNASRENPGEFFQANYPEVRFLRSESNLGFAGGNNLALPFAQGSFLFFVNNDAELAPGCLETLLKHFEHHPETGILSPLICYFPTVAEQPCMIQYAGMTPVSRFTGRNRTIGERAPDRGQFTTPGQTAYAHGAAMMVPRQVIESVGSMWEGFFLYYEELDWCERIRRAGLEVWVEPRARVWHKESLTLGKMGDTKTYFLTRNRILFMRRNVRGWRLAGFVVFWLTVSLPTNTAKYLLAGQISILRAFLRGGRTGWQASDQSSTKGFPK